MSATSPSPSISPADVKDFVSFSEKILGLRLSDAQKRILRAIENNQRTLVWGANGPGKSFVTAALKLAFLFGNPDSIVMGTSGSYQQYEDTMWRPLKKLYKDARKEKPLPGRLKGGNRPILEIDDDWYAKIVSPRDPGELEGRHDAHVLVVIDEADKKYVTHEHFDSAGSSVTDLNDKFVVICNPPRDETNVVAEKKESDRWEVVEVSAFESHNALIDAGQLNDKRIPGLVDLITIASDWEEWNNREWPLAEKSYPKDDWPGMPTISNWLESGQVTRQQVVDWLAPGFNVAKEAHLRWDTLDERWYIRRAGVIPPTGAEAHRPIQPKDVENAWSRPSPPNVTKNPRAVGIDVARSGDRTVMIGEHTGELRVHYKKQGTNHERQKRDVVEGAATTPGLQAWEKTAPDIAVDKGYAPGFHDYINDHIPNVVDFMAGTKPVEETRWYDKWAEGLFYLGEWLAEGGTINSPELREELMMAARTISYEERALNSRGDNGAEVYKATSKDKIREELGRSPDFLDAALMAVWRLKVKPETPVISSTWYDPYAEA